MAERIYIAGHKGMVGSALLRSIGAAADLEVITVDRSQLDLTDYNAVDRFFYEAKPTQVYCAAARVGGILANDKYPADFIAENLFISNNVIALSKKHNVKKLLYLGSSCVYPKNLYHPMNETDLLSGPLEGTNKSYAIAKIAGIQMCHAFNVQYETDFRCVMPSNLFGMNDNYHGNYSHFIPALIRKLHTAKVRGQPEVVLWGSGRPRREITYVDDFAKSCFLLMGLSKPEFQGLVKHSNMSFINIGSGYEISIRDASRLISEIVGYSGEVAFDESKPDGVQRKLMDSSAAIRAGLVVSSDIRDALEKTYGDFLQQVRQGRLETCDGLGGLS